MFYKVPHTCVYVCVEREREGMGGRENHNVIFCPKMKGNTIKKDGITMINFTKFSECFMKFL